MSLHVSAKGMLLPALGVLCAGGGADAATIGKVRIGEHSGYTRLVLDLTGPTAMSLEPGADGRSVVAVLPDADWSAPTGRTYPDSRYLAAYAAEPAAGGGYRLRIDGKGPVTVTKIMHLDPDGRGYGHRIVLDIAEGSADSAAAAAPPAAIPSAADGMGLDAGKAVVASSESFATAAVVTTPMPGDPSGDMFVAPQLSTLGLGAEAGYRVNGLLGIRGGGNYFSTDRNREIDGIDYDVSATLASVGLTADIYPFDSGFHVSGGVRYNLTDASFAATPRTLVNVGGTTYTPTQVGTLSGDVEFNRFAPYLGVGWKGSVFSPNLYVSTDVGVLFQGSPQVSLSSNGSLSSAQFQADLERERQSIEDDLRGLRFYPVVALSAGYRF